MQRPCNGCARRDVEIADLRQKNACSNLEIEQAQTHIAGLTSTKDGYMAKVSERNALIHKETMEKGRATQHFRSQEDQLRLSQDHSEKVRSEYLAELEDRDTQFEQRTRTAYS